MVPDFRCRMKMTSVASVLELVETSTAKHDPGNNSGRADGWRLGGGAGVLTGATGNVAVCCTRTLSA